MSPVFLYSYFCNHQQLNRILSIFYLLLRLLAFIDHYLSLLDSREFGTKTFFTEQQANGRFDCAFHSRTQASVSENWRIIIILNLIVGTANHDFAVRDQLMNGLDGSLAMRLYAIFCL